MTNGWTINYNDYSDTAQTNEIYYNTGSGESFGLPVMQASGFDLASITNNPQFISVAYSSGTNSWQNNYGILSNLPVRGSGGEPDRARIAGLNVDINGNPRPATNNWDIGAYQH